MWHFQSVILIFQMFGELYWVNKKIEEHKMNQLHSAIWFNAFTARPCAMSPKGLPIHSVCQICVYICGGFARFSPGNQSKSGKNKNRVFKKSYNVCAHPEPMHHVTRAQRSRQNGSFSRRLYVYFMSDWTMRCLQGCSELSCNSFVDKVTIWTNSLLFL